MALATKGVFAVSAKLFVTDMDGTLLNSERKISAGNKAMIKKAVEAGVIFTIATGRMYASALPFAKDLGVEVPIITYNGAVIKTTAGKEIFTSYLDEDLIKEVLDFTKEKGLYVQVYSDDKLYFKENDRHAQVYQQACGVMGQAVGEDIYKYTAKVPKMLIVGDDPEKADEAVEMVRQAFAGRVESMKSAPTYVEIIKPGVNKATAIKRLAESFGIAESEVLAIGDSSNDVTMIQAAAYGVAMGNANAEDRAAAKYTVADCCHDGVAEALQRFCLE